MGYNKVIISGSNFEVYQYEKSLNPRSRKGLCKKRSDNENLVDNGDDVRQSSVITQKRKDSARSASMAFRRLVACNLGGGPNPLLVTLTYAENCTDIRQGYSDFTAFIQALRYKFGQVFRYVSVPEFQKRGAVHFHALIWDLPSSVFLEERKTRTLARLWGRGFVYLKETDGNDKLSSYLSKYMAKAFVDLRLKNQKAYVGSRNLKRSIVHSDIDLLWVLFDNYKINEFSPLLDREYSTHYMGKGRYRLYKITS